MILLARLAVNQSEKGRGLGAALLKDALLRSLQAADIIGCRAVLVHAKDQQAQAFYRKYGFESSPVDEFHLYLLMKDIQASLGGTSLKCQMRLFRAIDGLLHHPGYRTNFADNLKRELPGIPFAPHFRAFAKAGKQLAELHLNYEELEPYSLKYVETKGVPLSYVVEKMKLSKDKTSVRVNE